jgi:penicillin-binding protein 1A
MWKKFALVAVVLAMLGGIGVGSAVYVFSSNLPRMISVADYHPLLVSEVYDRNNEKFGEFFREKRMLLTYDQIPEKVVQAFVAAEDSTFFEHHGLNYVAMLRAFLTNLKSGRKAQGASTITQQVARTLLLSSEKTYTRKIKEILLSQKMEENLSKKDILYLYLNQIYLGEGAYGVGAAAQIYFRKNVKDLTIPEAAILAGLPQAPSRYSPIGHPRAAKERQRYVLHRMSEGGYITAADEKKFAETPVTLYVWQNFKELAPFYLETIRQQLIKAVGEETVLDKGIKVFAAIDIKKQLHAQDDLQRGLRAVDKRQGFRGANRNIQDAKEIAEFLLQSRNVMMDEASPVRTLRPDGGFELRGPLNLANKDETGKEKPNLPDYIPLGKIVKGVVTKVDDEKGLTYVRFGEAKGIIDIDSMKWARKVDPNLRSEDNPLRKPSDAVKIGDVIELKVADKQFRSERLSKPPPPPKKKGQKVKLADNDLSSYREYALVELEQTPIVEASLLSIDEKTSDVLAMVGGYDFARSQFNRVLQAARQTGSSFKAIVYASALDKGYTPATPIIDAPIVYEEKDEGQDDKDSEKTKVWKPKNVTNKFTGDILFRNALIRSMNVPTVKITENVGIPWATTYARRLGIFSPLNNDFTMALGSSAVTLYEMTRAFTEIAKLGRRTTPVLVHKVVDADGKTLVENMTVDQRFENEMKGFAEDFEKKRQEYLAAKEKNLKIPPIYFEDPDQLMKPSTAYVITSLLQGVIDEPGGTGGAARAIGRPAAGKTGSTSGYYDAWFIGFTPDIVTGVWVGYDDEKSLGRGEVGGKAALPIWLDYMKFAHESLPPRSFPVPDGVVFANIDNDSGELVSSGSRAVVRQAFLDGTEPNATNTAKKGDDKDFYKQDMTD